MVPFSEFFTDPILMAPTIGSMLMCLVGALIGTFAVLKRYALIGEMLSHACYPGVIIFFLIFPDIALSTVMVGAALSCIAATFLQSIMTNRFRIKTDAVLTFILASFFGVGLTILTSVQNSYPTLFRKMQGYLFGQAATMTNEHIWLYLVIATAVGFLLFFFYRLLAVSIFDPGFAKVSGMNVSFAHSLLIALIIVATVVGIRSVGVVLMSSMLVFPSVCARFWTDRFLPLLLLSSFFGLFFGFFGIYLSHCLSLYYGISFASGPTIVLVAGVVFVISILFSKKKGLLLRIERKISFWNRCQQENLLKAMWKYCETKPITFSEVQAIFHENRFVVSLLLRMLKKRGYCRAIDQKVYVLTASGMHKARKVVRLHRLWEVYLVEYCGVSKDRVHPSAEEMEHILTPEIEIELERLLKNPQTDPHEQPIPPREIVSSELPSGEIGQKFDEVSS